MLGRKKSINHESPALFNHRSMDIVFSLFFFLNLLRKICLQFIVLVKISELGNQEEMSN